jgi:NADH-quinone oxidoreductase subunit L
VGFILGIMLIWVNLHTLNVQAVLAGIGGLDHTTISWIALLILCGAVGKSAQFPLHVWLPDAMEGPTPVSALIHAATMVNAGVYLIARTSPIFARAPEIMVVVAALGTFTAILAASIAFTQTDIKRVLAYSTLSQLGYMFAALGVGAWAAAIFHLMAHGFFKGLLFLDSGSVIHAVHDEQDMRKMGGLSKKIPITYWTMLIGSVAISGIPPLAGFFSKDEILGDAFKNGFLWVWAIGFLVAAMTAFYMFRLIGLTFWGESRVDPAVEPTIHESGRAMTIPLILLAIPTIFIGLFLGLPFGASRLQGWLEPVFAPTVALANRSDQPFALFGIDGALILASVTVAAIGIVLAWRFFGVNLGPLRSKARLNTVSAIASANGATRFLYRASLNKWWFDELNDLLFIRIGGRIANGLWWFDRNVVDGAVNGTGRVVSSTGGRLRRIQTGRVQNYALGIAVGLIVMAAAYLVIAGSR